MKNFILIYCLFVANISLAQQIDYGQYKGISVNILQSGMLDSPYLYDYEINSVNLDSVVTKPFINNTAESMLTQKESELLTQNEVKNFIRLKSKLSFNHDGFLVSIIKYQVIRDSINTKNRVIQCYNKNGVWEIINIPEVTNVEYVIKQLSSDGFWQFYNKENNPKYPEINKLKPLVKDANGVLNIEKLAQVINENKASLSKYLDE